MKTTGCGGSSSGYPPDSNKHRRNCGGSAHRWPIGQRASYHWLSFGLRPTEWMGLTCLFESGASMRQPTRLSPGGLASRAGIGPDELPPQTILYDT
jgi:hypothetical protein